MVKIKFIGSVDLVSKGIRFEPGAIYEVDDKVAEYLEKTFGVIEVLDKPKQVKEEPKVVVKPTETKGK